MPEAARAICRKILDHKGISETTMYSVIILIRSGKFMDYGLLLIHGDLISLMRMFSVSVRKLPLSEYVFCREGKFVRRASHK